MTRHMNSLLEFETGRTECVPTLTDYKEIEAIKPDDKNINTQKRQH